ncbi:hypothetical protein [Breznakiella homolactica]|uniref:DUF432 domain-containing protein n=1 Tax=Breznakiella homolactica TaxID=2798577 RepID=A0A7T7XNT1_9SPIR|nr:hypothetical protein [Breznakiella homolactica]QQO09721.1 hypothetical protein JFL75_02040 [Breznakiella homolactica]
MWNHFEPREGQWYRWSLNGAFAYIQKKDEEWRAGFIRTGYAEMTADFRGPEEADPPDDMETVFSIGKGKRIALRPYLSDKPYLVSVQNSIRLLPGAETRFDVTLPPVVRFEITKDETLAEAMPLRLSETWFGDTMSGTLCVSLPTSLVPRVRNTPAGGEPENSEAEQDPESILFSDALSLIHCEMVVRNISKVPMDLDHLAIYTDILNVYEYKDHLISDTVVMDGLSGGELKMFVRTRSHPAYKKITSGTRGGVGEVLIHRGVDFLKTLTAIQH